MVRLAHIWRHPIKGLGSESLERADLSPEGALHGDRAWALLNAAAPDSDAWQPRRNFLQVASGPALAAIRAETLAHGLRLSHAERPTLEFDPATEGARLAAWVAPLWPKERPAPARLVRAPGHGMTDMAEPFVSIASLASLRALSQRVGQPLDMRRFRINLWLDGPAPWEEAEWIGRRLTLGDVAIHVAQPIERCRAPEADPATGHRNVDTARHLDAAGQSNCFGIYARVVTTGAVRVGDELP